MPALLTKQTYCKHGHLLAGNIVREGGFNRCKTCRRLMRREREKKRILSKEKIKGLLAGLQQGFTIRQMTGNMYRHDATMHVVSGARPVYNFMRLNPKLGAKMRALSWKNATKNCIEAGQNARAIAAPALLRNNGLDAYEIIRRATAHMQAGDRDDVMSLMFVALGEGRLKLADASSRAGEFLRMHRRHPRVFGDAVYRLDAPLGDDSKMTWLDTVAEDRRLWA